MENLPTKQPQSLENLSEPQIKLAQELEQLNEIYAPFKLSDDDLARWAKRISEIEPTITAKIAGEIVLKFIKGKYRWDKNLGVTNIFLAYIRHRTNDQVY